MAKVKVPDVIKAWFQTQGIDKIEEFLEFESKVQPVFLMNPQGSEGYVLDPLSGERGVFQHQAQATLNQAAPVQNTWYTVLDTTENVRVIGINFQVAVADETLELRLTIDSVILVGTQAAVAATTYFALLGLSAAALMVSNDEWEALRRGFMVEGRSVKVELRKTTALGAGNLTARVTYAKIP